MTAEKVVPTDLPSGNSRLMDWEVQRQRRRWQAPIEVEATQVGQLLLLANTSFERAWTFKLVFRGEGVYRWDMRPSKANHQNSEDCPPDFDAKVKAPCHEHIWIENLDCFCAKELGNVGDLAHQQALSRFCQRAGIVLDVPYVHPITEPPLF
jgi:hypothetical protein